MFGVMLRRREHKIIALVIVLLLLGAGIFLFFIRREEETSGIANFEECIVAGYPVMESYPRQCRDGDGNLHVEEITYPVNPEG